MLQNIMNLLCGIGLFLAGMNLMNDGLTLTFGDKMKSILAKLAKTKLRSVLTGTAVTGIIQSSSAVSVMAVGFAQTGILTLSQATGIIMGANIGTTVTNLLIAFNFSDFAPLFVLFGSVVRLFSENKKIHLIGESAIGFGMIFLGLETMSEAFAELKDNQVFLSIISSSSGKIGGILTGTLMTCIIQSSSASVGILQSLYSQGLVSTESALFIVVGQNIGTVLTAIISAVGKNTVAKQVAVIHLLFNVIGGAVFLLIYPILPIEELLNKIENPSMQISGFHTIFNILSVVVLYPFYDLLIKASRKIVCPDFLMKAKKRHAC